MSAQTAREKSPSSRSPPPPPLPRSSSSSSAPSASSVLSRSAAGGSDRPRSSTMIKAGTRRKTTTDPRKAKNSNKPSGLARSRSDRDPSGGALPSCSPPLPSSASKKTALARSPSSSSPFSSSSLGKTKSEREETSGPEQHQAPGSSGADKEQGELRGERKEVLGSFSKEENKLSEETGGGTSGKEERERRGEVSASLEEKTGRKEDSSLSSVTPGSSSQPSSCSQPSPGDLGTRAEELFPVSSSVLSSGKEKEHKKTPSNRVVLADNNSLTNTRTSPGVHTPPLAKRGRNSPAGGTPQGESAEEASRSSFLSLPSAERVSLPAKKSSSVLPREREAPGTSSSSPTTSLSPKTSQRNLELSRREPRSLFFSPPHRPPSSPGPFSSPDPGEEEEGKFSTVVPQPLQLSSSSSSSPTRRKTVSSLLLPLSSSGAEEERRGGGGGRDFSRGEEEEARGLQYSSRKTILHSPPHSYTYPSSQKQQVLQELSISSVVSLAPPPIPPPFITPIPLTMSVHHPDPPASRGVPSSSSRRPPPSPPSASSSYSALHNNQTNSQGTRKNPPGGAESSNEEGRRKQVLEGEEGVRGATIGGDHQTFPANSSSSSSSRDYSSFFEGNHTKSDATARRLSSSPRSGSYVPSSGGGGGAFYGSTYSALLAETQSSHRAALGGLGYDEAATQSLGGASRNQHHLKMGEGGRGGGGHHQHQQRVSASSSYENISGVCTSRGAQQSLDTYSSHILSQHLPSYSSTTPRQTHREQRGGGGGDRVREASSYRARTASRGREKGREGGAGEELKRRGGGGGGKTTMRAVVLILIGVCIGLAIWPVFVSFLTFRLLSLFQEFAGGGGGDYYQNGDYHEGFDDDDESIDSPPRTPPPPSYENQMMSPRRNNTDASSPPHRPHTQPPNKRPAGSSGDSTAANMPPPPPPPPPTAPPLTFADLAGLTEAKTELHEVVEFLKDPSKFERLGARLPKGVLLVGPPGTGKTALARAVATEAGVPYFYASGSEFVEIYVGQGARRVRGLFAYARHHSPCIVFLDELDAVGGKRQASLGPGAGNREHDQTLNQLLVEMDGFNQTNRIVVLAATNRVDTLDPALLRPGRFDRIVHVSLPDVAAREQILQKYLLRVPVVKPPSSSSSSSSSVSDSESEEGGPANKQKDGAVGELETSSLSTSKKQEKSSLAEPESAGRRRASSSPTERKGTTHGEFAGEGKGGDEEKKKKEEDASSTTTTPSAHDQKTGEEGKSPKKKEEETLAGQQYRKASSQRERGGSSEGEGEEDKKKSLARPENVQTAKGRQRQKKEKGSAEGDRESTQARKTDGAKEEERLEKEKKDEGKKVLTPVHKELAKKIAKITPGFSGAELENLVNEAALLAARANKEIVTLHELQEARDKVTMGPARRSRVMSLWQKQLTAYHEAGHAVIAFYLQPYADPIHKATIVSRGSALGFVEQVPLEDRYGHGIAQLEARLCVCMGGRVAERLIFGRDALSNGASSDIETATRMAYVMVTEWGMSEKLGPLSYKVHGRSRRAFISSETASLVEEEVKQLVLTAERKAEKLLRRHRRQLKKVALELLERETLSGEEISNILDPSGSYRRKIDKLRARMQQGEQPNWFQRVVVRVKRAFDWMFLPKSQTELAIETELAGKDEPEEKEPSERKRRNAERDDSSGPGSGGDDDNSNIDPPERKENEKTPEKNPKQPRDGTDGGGDDSNDNGGSGAPGGDGKPQGSLGNKRLSSSEMPKAGKEISDGTEGQTTDKADTKEEGLHHAEEGKTSGKGNKSRAENTSDVSSATAAEDGKQQTCVGQGGARENVDKSPPATSRDSACYPSGKEQENFTDERDILLGQQENSEADRHLDHENEDSRQGSYDRVIGDVFIPSRAESGEAGAGHPRYATLARHADDRGREFEKTLSSSSLGNDQEEGSYPLWGTAGQEGTRRGLLHETRQRVRPHARLGTDTSSAITTAERIESVGSSRRDGSKGSVAPKESQSQCHTVKNHQESVVSRQQVHDERRNQSNNTNNKGDARKRVQRQWQLTPWGMGLVTVTRE